METRTQTQQRKNCISIISGVSGLVSNPPAVPLRPLQHHRSAGFKNLSLSPFCIPVVSPNEDYGGDSVTPPHPAVRPHQSQLCQWILGGLPPHGKKASDSRCRSISDLTEEAGSPRNSCTGWNVIMWLRTKKLKFQYLIICYHPTFQTYLNPH